MSLLANRMLVTHFWDVSGHPLDTPGTLKAAPDMLVQLRPLVVCRSAVHTPRPVRQSAEPSPQPCPNAKVRSRIFTPVRSGAPIGIESAELGALALPELALPELALLETEVGVRAGVWRR